MEGCRKIGRDHEKEKMYQNSSNETHKQSQYALNAQYILLTPVRKVRLLRYRLVFPWNKTRRDVLWYICP